MTILYEKEYVFDTVPADSGYIQENGLASADYLIGVHHSNKERAKDFIAALDLSFVTNYNKQIIVKWSVESVDE